MKKSGFTLAEILIALMILGVIASLTIPSLIQSTQKKEEVVKIKKGLSMVNQAIATNYALTNNDLSTIVDADGIMNIFNKRLSIVKSYSDGNGECYFLTQDGLLFVFQAGHTDPFNPNNSINANNHWGSFNLLTKIPEAGLSDEELPTLPQAATKGHLTGNYTFYCSYDRCVPTDDTTAIMNATDPTKVS